VAGVEDTASDAVRKWAPAYENCTLTPLGEATKFEADLDAEDSFVDMFNEMWPKALEKLKGIAERLN